MLNPVLRFLMQETERNARTLGLARKFVIQELAKRFERRANGESNLMPSHVRRLGEMVSRHLCVIFRLIKVQS